MKGLNAAQVQKVLDRCAPEIRALEKKLQDEAIEEMTGLEPYELDRQFPLSTQDAVENLREDVRIEDGLNELLSGLDEIEVSEAAERYEQKEMAAEQRAELMMDARRGLL